MLSNLGAIHNRARAQQQIDFSGLLFGNITPTDIDGVIEYKGKSYVIIETKLRDTPVELGQKLALARMTDDLTASGKFALCIITRHEIDDPYQDIDAANTFVSEYRWKKQWHELMGRKSRTAKEMITSFFGFLRESK